MKPLVTSTIALLGILGLVVHVGDHHDINWAHDVIAAQSVAQLSVDCVDPVVVSFVPDLSYNIVVPATSASTPASPGALSVNSTLNNAVNSDGNPSTNLDSSNSGILFRYYHRGPYVKIGGVQCSTNSTATLVVHGDGTDDTQYNVAFQGSSSSNWSGSNQVDQRTSGNAATIFGSSGLVGTSAIADGSDADSIVNGEIAFGGESGGAAYRLFNSVQYLDTNTLSHTETLTYIFTPN